MNFWVSAFLVLNVSVSVATAANAAEAITYTYDVRGRIVQVAHTGTVNNGITTTYIHDTADNRTQVQTSGASH